MAELGQFDTDSAALVQRIQAHERYGSNDLNRWIFDHLDLREGLAVLDIGCGTGKQSLPVAARVGPTGSVVAVDISPESLSQLAAGARQGGLHGWILPVESSLDELGVNLPDRTFDRVVASYSLYYVKDATKLFGWLYGRLKRDGVFFFCGPSRENNAELKRFHDGLRPRSPGQQLVAAAEFMEHTGQTIARQTFADVRVYTFENALRFESADALFKYWSSYNLYDPALADDFMAAAKAFFQVHPYFETVKRVLGIRASR